MITYETFEQDLKSSQSTKSAKSTRLRLFFYFEDNKLFQVSFGKDSSLKGKQATFQARPSFIKAFKDFFNGKKPFDLKQISLKGTPFQVAVWKQILSIPRGKNLSYKEIAERIGRPNAYRAVGSATGKNSFSVIVPCHRVLHSGKNKVGKYGGGEALKKALLEHEGIILSD